MRLRARGFLRLLAIGATAVSIAGAVALPAAAQTATPTPTPAPPPLVLTVTTTYPSIEVDPGGEARFPLSVTSPTPERVDLAVTSVPEGFKASLRGGGAIVASVFTGATPPALELRVTAPDTAVAGSYKVVLTATAADGSVELPLDLVIADTSGGAVSLTTDFPDLRGDSSATFQFNLSLDNETSQELTFVLEGTGPDGWDVTVVLASQAQAATAVVAAGDKANIKVTVKPALGAIAGEYPVLVTATAGSYSPTAPLRVELTGSYAMTLTAPDGRLNTTVTGGSSSTYAVAVQNDGTAPLTGVTLSATAPVNWKVTFDTPTIDSIPVDGTATGTATITPASNAVSGDYVITFTAKSDQVTNKTMQVRTTVETSSLWGFVGIALIVLVLIGLFLVFRRYGRR